MMLQTSTRKVEIFDIEISSLDGRFKMGTEASKVDKSVLLTVPNPQYNQLVNQYRPLKEVKMSGGDKREELPIHLIIGAAEYARIKTRTKPRIGQQGEPVAELTELGWTIMSPGKDSNLSKLYLARSSSEDYEQLCNLDCLGLEDRNSAEVSQHDVYERFQEHLQKSPEGWYQTNLIWKGDNTPESNEKGSLGRLQHLVQRLEKNPDLYNQYDEIMQTQLKEGIIEEAPAESTGIEF